jgi:hypothetical protein
MARDSSEMHGTAEATGLSSIPSTRASDDTFMVKSESSEFNALSTWLLSTSHQDCETDRHVDAQPAASAFSNAGGDDAPGASTSMKFDETNDYDAMNDAMICSAAAIMDTLPLARVLFTDTDSPGKQQARQASSETPGADMSPLLLPPPAYKSHEENPCPYDGESGQALDLGSLRSLAIDFAFRYTETHSDGPRDSAGTANACVEQGAPLLSMQGQGQQQSCSQDQTDTDTDADTDLLLALLCTPTSDIISSAVSVSTSTSSSSAAVTTTTPASHGSQVSIVYSGGGPRPACDRLAVQTEREEDDDEGANSQSP